MKNSVDGLDGMPVSVSFKLFKDSRNQAPRNKIQETNKGEKIKKSLVGEFDPYFNFLFIIYLVLISWFLSFMVYYIGV